MKIIANIGYNWWSNKDDMHKRAHALVDAAIGSGVSGICIPFYQAEKVHRIDTALKQMKKFNIKPEIFYDLKQKVDDNGKDFYAAPSDVTAVDYLDSISVKKFHIENGNIKYVPLLEKLAKRPVLLSTGFSTFTEIDEALNILIGEQEASKSELVLMHSTGAMPTQAREVQLRRILDIASEFFPLYVGVESFFHDRLFDFVSMAFDPAVIMRRMDLADKKGIESLYSLTPKEMETLVRISSLMDSANNPEYYHEEFVEGDFEARINRMKCSETDYTLPPEN